MCACGCGLPVKRARTGWNTFLRNHQMIGRTGTALQSASARERMLARNPMKDPEVAQRVSLKTRGKPINRSPEGTKAIADAARRRMLSANNPMKNAATHRAALIKAMSRSQPSKNEAHFMAWLQARGITLEFTGLGGLWVGRRNPDFRVPGQKKLIEVTQRECFTNQRKPRTVDEYGAQTARHYLSKGWQVLVIWKKDHRCLIPEPLADVIRRFVSPESLWTGAWHYDRLLTFDGFRGEFVSTT